MVARVLGPGSVISKDLARRGPSSAVSTARRSWLPPCTASHILWRHPQGSLQHNHRIGRGLPQNLPASLSCPPRLGRRSRTALPTQRDSSHSGWRAAGRSLLWHWQRSSCKTGQRKWPSQRRVILPMNGQVPLENTTATRSQQAWSSGDLQPTPQLSSRGPCPGPSFARGKGPGVGPGWLWPWSGGPRCRRGLRSRAGRQSTRYTFWRCPAASEKWIAWDCQAPTFFLCVAIIFDSYWFCWKDSSFNATFQKNILFYRANLFWPLKLVCVCLETKQRFCVNDVIMLQWMGWRQGKLNETMVWTSSGVLVDFPNIICLECLL